jgi:mono/diheme cytochrome c family protein
MTNRRTGRRNGGLLLGGGGLLFLAALTWVVLDVEPLRGAQAASAQAPSDTYKKVYDGWKWWHVYCYRCHGVDAVGVTNAPNLIDPNSKLGRAEFMKIVKVGAPDKGMQAWDKLLDDKQIGDLYFYVRARADKVLPPGRPDEVGPKGGAWEPAKGWAPR